MQIVSLRQGIVFAITLATLAPAVTAFECLIEPNQVVEVRSPVEGLIEEVSMHRGDAVKEGQIVVRLDSDVEQSAVDVARYRAEMTGQVQAAKDRVEYTRKKSERLINLQGNSFVSTQHREEAEADRRLAESELTEAVESRELARLEHKRAIALLARRALKSPLNGYVTERSLNPGDLAEPSAGAQSILKLVELDPLKVEVTLPMEMFGKVTGGMHVELTTEIGDLAVKAEVATVDPELDAKSGTYRVHLRLANPGNAIPAGTRCEANFPGIDGAIESTSQRAR